MNLGELPSWYFVTVAAVFGALVGSFLNVVIARVPRGLSVVRPASRCPGCERAIAWHENVPIVSWLLLGGRCRGCEMRISIRYPLVELAASLLAVACYRQFGPTPWAVGAFAFLAALVALTYIDLDHWLLPRSITIPFIALGLGAAFLPGRVDGVGIASSALGAAAGFAAFATVGYIAERILKKEALGGGDLWLFAMIGAWLGAKALLPVALLASSQGAIVGVVLLWLAQRRARKEGRGEALGPEGKPAGAEQGAAQPASAVQMAFAGATESGLGAGTEDEEARAGSGQMRSAEDSATQTASSRDVAAGSIGPLMPPPKPTGDPELDDWTPPEGAVPFGPFLALAAAQYLFFGERLLEWYLSLIHFQG